MNNLPEVNKLIEHFFRYESGKMISVLTGIFGTNNLVLVEDIVQDAVIEAISKWTYYGIPENPVGWLYTVAKNKAFNAIKREKYLKNYTFENLQLLEEHRFFESSFIEVFSDESILDDQLRMMFMCCHPSISKDSQITIILKTLCGFSINEIAKSFLTNNENISKRLVRARKTIRENDIPFELPSKKDLDSKVDAVLESIYLIFNEGYSASNGEQLIRVQLCEESIRLVDILIKNSSITNKSDIYALKSLMQLNSCRFSAREDDFGDILTLAEQDRSLWDLKVMEKGFSNLTIAAQSTHISKYHILASISAYHCSAKDFESTDWKSILLLYDKLLTIDYSPIVTLNRAIVLAQLGLTITAIDELESIENHKVIKSHYLFFSVKAQFLQQVKDYSKAKKSLQKAIKLAPFPAEKKMLKTRLDECIKKNKK